MFRHFSNIMFRYVSLLLIISCFFFVNAYPGTVRLRDEGADKGYVAEMDFVGSNVAVSRTGIKGTVTISADDGTPAGSDGEVQYNNGGAFGGASSLYYDDVNGRVGIGTTGPNGLLDVEGSSPKVYINDNSAGDPGILFQEGGTNKWEILNDRSVSSQFQIRGDSNNTVFTIVQDGNVGIGTTSPNASLDINPTITSTSDAKMLQSGIVYDGATAMTNWYGAYISAPTGTGTITNKYAFVTEANAGNVGIGTTAPKTTLEVNGSVGYTPSSTIDITAAGGITITNTVMRIRGSGGAIDITAIPQIADGQDGQIVILQGDDDTNTVKLDDGNGLALDSDASFTMGKGDIIQLTFDSEDDIWYEITRTNN